MKKIVIIGFGAAAYSALMTLKRLRCGDDITIVDPKGYDLFHPCGLPFAIEGKADASGLVQNIGLERAGVRKLRGMLDSIDVKSRSIEIIVPDGHSVIDYDTLLLATGSNSVIPKIPGVETFLNKGIFTLSSVEDLSRLEREIAVNRKCAVIGAGAIGLESAAAIKSRGCDVTVIEMRESIMPDIFDRDIASTLEEMLSDRGMTIMKESKVIGFSGDDKLTDIKIDDEMYNVDFCVLAVGRTPAVQYIPREIECDPILGILTDETMRTRDLYIYAAGDCAVTRSSIDGKPIPAKLATSSFNQGVTAAYQIAGHGGKYRGSAGTFVSVIAGIEAAATGFNTTVAKERGFDPVSVRISSTVRPEYFKDNERVTIKVIADRKSSRIIGGQAIGANASARVNLIGSGILMNATVSDFESLETAYCPAISDVYDPLRRAIDGLRRRM